MDSDFWHARWRDDEIGFHQAGYNPWLLKCWGRLAIPAGEGVFVPLCGKSLDLRWLVDQGYAVQGIELAEVAIEAYFAESAEPFVLDTRGRFQRYTLANTEILCGDFFELTVNHLNAPAAVYDRAALIALPAQLRARYADHLLRIIPDGAQILLITLEYSQELVEGPPFSVSPEEVTIHFEERCSVRRLESQPTDVLPPKFAAGGVDRAVESVYQITKEQ
jgi:thiopurine S-methyltransferase